MANHLATINELKIFSGHATAALTAEVCKHLKMPVGQARTIIFPTGSSS